MTGKVYVVVWADRHSDTSVRVFSRMDDACEWAKRMAIKYDRHSELCEHTLTTGMQRLGWRYRVSYGDAGGLTVIEVEVDAEVPVTKQLDDLAELSDICWSKFQAAMDSATELKELVTDERLPKLIVLPSGRPFRMDLLIDTKEFTPDKLVSFDGQFRATFIGNSDNFSADGAAHLFYDETDAAAIRAVIARYGVKAEL